MDAFIEKWYTADIDIVLENIVGMSNQTPDSVNDNVDLSSKRQSAVSKGN